MKTLALALLVFAAGCHFRGGGPQREETRQVAPFSAIEISGAIWLTATAGAPQSVKVKASADLLSHVRTEVTGEVLHIYTKGVSFSSAPVVTVTVPNLKSIEASGATHIRVDGLNEAQLALSVSGASNLAIGGKCQHLSIESSGAAKIDTRDLSAESVVFSGSGACSATVTATHTVSATLSGACRLSIAGHPASIERHTSGASSIDVE